MLYMQGDCVQCLDDSDTELVHKGWIYRIIDTRPDDMIGLGNIHGYTVWMHKYRFTSPFTFPGSTALAGETAPMKNAVEFDPYVHRELRLEAIMFPITFTATSGRTITYQDNISEGVWDNGQKSMFGLHYWIERYNTKFVETGDYSYVMGE